MTGLTLSGSVFNPECWSKEQKSEPVITIKTSEKTIKFKRSDLLSKNRPTASGFLIKKNLTTLVVEKDPAYEGKKMTYQAVPIHSLFEGLKVSPTKEGTILYRCLDGFSSAISMERLLNSSPDKSIAYLAIEPETKWPKMPDKPGDQTPGPFYVVWSNPGASQINSEEWPFQVIGFEVKKSMQESYPNIFPEAGLDENSPVRKGFKVFTQVCFNCHTMNLQGESHVGPDLNNPMNPTEYFKEGILKTFVRDPKSVRHWTNAIMPPFPAEVVSDIELENLELYFKHMSNRKVKSH
ncbi:MAG: cytochrome c [Bdellovibrionia bacterium]